MEDPLSCTARWMAAARARESRRPDRLFDDPFAQALAGVEGLELLDRIESVSRLPGMVDSPDSPYFAIRTRFFDDFLAGAVRVCGTRQVVLVAAGLDSRAYRIDWPDGTRIFELDRRELLASKHEILERMHVRARCDLHAVGVDLTAAWEGALVAAGFDRAAQSVWVIEGLLAYLDESLAHALIARTASLASVGDRLATDLPGQGFFSSPWTKSYLEAVAREGVPWKFGTDDPEGLFARHGWRANAVRPGEQGANFGRWPYPIPPRGTPRVPSSYFVTAIRMQNAAR